MSLYDGLSLVIASVALVFSIYNYRKTRQLTAYSNVDTLYFELLKLGMEHPDFLDPEYTCDYETKFEGTEKAKYEIYAFMAWNICETIADSRKSNAKFFTTWQPVLHCENRLHRRWFDKEENQIKFKREFREYIQDNEGSPLLLNSHSPDTTT